MQLRKLLSAEEERAVSPVIGVILMVAITVILAAVIGTFVLGLGDQVQTTAPNSQISFDVTDDTMTISHDGGQSVEAGLLKVSTDVGHSDIDEMEEGDETWADVTANDGEIDDMADGDEVSAGDSITLTYNPAESGWANQDNDVSLIWEDGGQSQSLQSWEP